MPASTDPLANRLALTPIAQTSPPNRWRTEAMRSHAAPRLLFFAKGQGRITVSGLTSGYGPNNLIFLPARTMYGFEVGQTVFGQILAIPVAMADEWPEEPVHLRLRDVTAQKELASLFDQLERELKSPKAGHSRAAHYHLGILSVFFERQIEVRIANPGENRSRTAAARLVAAYADLIERDFHRHQGVAGYAAALGVTPTHLTRCCKLTSTRSAHALLNDRILFEARQLLRDTRTPINQIATQLGFTSAAYFSRSFQNETGQTPSKFRRLGTGERAVL